ncbi:TetR/AcrR family transcriptional regulator [Pseudonocardia sp. GCM10023141]|uniref:TetR/AcrR family transcriptional regulator n=1 Tax=Pseudonocardia sp. GCM10023141 TaxID=3252653 RepID=UPI00361ADBC6
MTVGGDEPVGDGPRARAARTKRRRTRAALIAAADSAFSTRGWAGTRMEDIATDACVSSATAYNHFPTKHVLIGVVFAPHVTKLVIQAERDIARERPVLAALSDQINALARLSYYHRGLTAAFTAAVLEYTIRTGRTQDPTDELDPRTIVPLLDPLVRLIRHGQQTGQLRPDPSAADMSSTIANLLLVRSLNHKDESPRVTAELLWTLLFRTLAPPG